MPDSAAVSEPVIWVLVASLLLLLVVVVGTGWYLITLRRDYTKHCAENDGLPLFAISPMGVPAGTIRSLLAIFIVIFSIGFLLLGHLALNRPLPEALTAVLGTVLGFYFGARTGSGASDADSALQQQVENLRKDRDEVVDAQQSEAKNEMLKKIRKGIRMSKSVAVLLPEHLREKYEGVVDKLEKGAKKVEDLAEVGKAVDAVKEAKEVFDVFRKDNPVRATVEKAMQSFGRVLGDVVPPLAVITAVVTIGAKLTGIAYQKWKARILHLPFSPAVIPLAVVDANTAFTLFLGSPLCKAAFRDRLAGQDRPFMLQAMEDFLKSDDYDALWKAYGQPEGPFESRADLEAAIEEFRRAAATLELRVVIAPEAAVAAGGLDPLLTAVDRLHADPEATADLDAVVTVFEGLQQSDEPAETILEKVTAEIAAAEPEPAPTA